MCVFFIFQIKDKLEKQESINNPICFFKIHFVKPWGFSDVMNYFRLVKLLTLICFVITCNFWLNDRAKSNTIWWMSYIVGWFTEFRTFLYSNSEPYIWLCWSIMVSSSKICLNSCYYIKCKHFLKMYKNYDTYDV